MTATTPKPDALAIAENDANPITRWEALASDIAIASEQAASKQFDYHDAYDNKQARSWVAQLRRLKGRIERARKDAKAVHLERGRAVDETARVLEASVQGLIQPHESALLAIEAAEQARIDGHRAVLDRIARLQEGVTTSADADARLAELAGISTDNLEEFAQAGANRKAEAELHLTALADDLRCQEAERAELEALRAEKAAREEVERLERVRREAIEQDRQRAIAYAIKQEAQIRREAEERQRASEERARIEREAAAAREAQALAAAEVARRAQEEAERRAAEAEARERARLEAEARAQAAEAAAEARRIRQAAARRSQLTTEITEALTGISAPDAADRIVAGTLHPALLVNWSSDW